MKDRHSEQGNVLFIILIAVALFAALSYAVTQSTRSGGASVDKEKIMISASELVQYADSIRVAAMRWTIVRNIDPDIILYNPPGSAFLTRQMFHPSGGGAIYRSLKDDLSELCTSSPCFQEGFEKNEVMADVGTSAADHFYWLGHINQSACEEINRGLGIGSVAQATTNYVYPYTYDAYPGLAGFCYQETAADGGKYWFVYTIIER